MTTLEPGQTIGGYEILGLLGRGGGGAVYRARDTRLDREVAIKAIPPELLQQPKAKARFEREARLLAKLNHPRIATIHAYETVDDLPLLVMELLLGESLEDRLERGDLSPVEALEICEQIAEGLEAAHGQGIIHRDLKPSNVFVTPNGVKLLDFGLAFPAGRSAGSDEQTLTRLTTTHTVMGTPAYMSPEQARGQTVDKRTDLWALGCLLFETLTGKRTFEGETLTDTLVAVLQQEPDLRDLATIPRAAILVERCLQKDREDRPAEASQIREELHQLRTQYRETGAWGQRLAALRRVRWGGLVRPGALVLLLAAACWVAWATWTSRAAGGPVNAVRFTLEHPPVSSRIAMTLHQPSLAVSPDGRRVVYSSEQAGASGLFLRDLEKFQSRLVPGTAGASGPFFSPDGESVGFLSEGSWEIRRVSLRDGRIETVARAELDRGASWGSDGRIVFAPSSASGLWSVDVEGGTPSLIVKPDPESGDRSFRWPSVLPGGDAVLYSVGSREIDSYDDGHIEAFSFATGERRVLVEGAMYPRYLETGHLLYARAGKLMALPFDAKRLRIEGDPIEVLDDLQTHPTTGAAQYAVSAKGDLVYLPGGPQTTPRKLLWAHRDGSIVPTGAPEVPYESLSISPDGRYIASAVDGANANLWLFDSQREAASRVTLDWNNLYPIWLPDGKRIAYASASDEPWDLHMLRPETSDPPALLHSSPEIEFPACVDPLGRYLIYRRVDSDLDCDLWMVPLDEQEGQPRPLFDSPAREDYCSISPDGEWIAYVSDAGAGSDVFVERFPEGGGKRQVSTRGGIQPRWSPRGDEIFYLAGWRILSVPVSDSSGLDIGKPVPVGPDPPILYFDVHPDGDRFAVIKDPSPKGPTAVHVVQGWSNEVLPLE